MIAIIYNTIDRTKIRSTRKENTKFIIIILCIFKNYSVRKQIGKKNLNS